MTSGEQFYLLLILVSFAAFAAMLGYQSWEQGKADKQTAAPAAKEASGA